MADPMSQLRRSFSNLGVNGDQLIGDHPNDSQSYQEYLCKYLVECSTAPKLTYEIKPNPNRFLYIKFNRQSLMIWVVRSIKNS